MKRSENPILRWLITSESTDSAKYLNTVWPKWDIYFWLEQVCKWLDVEEEWAQEACLRYADIIDPNKDEWRRWNLWREARMKEAGVL